MSHPFAPIVVHSSRFPGLTLLGTDVCSTGFECRPCPHLPFPPPPSTTLSRERRSSSLRSLYASIFLRVLSEFSKAARTFQFFSCPFFSLLSPFESLSLVRPKFILRFEKHERHPLFCFVIVFGATPLRGLAWWFSLSSSAHTAHCVGL